MKNHVLRYLVLTGCVLECLLGIGACVSVKLPSSMRTPAKDVQFQVPEKPFQEIKVLTADKAWLSAETGNTISFLSECNGNVDPTLEQLQNESLTVLDKLKILQAKNLEFNGREALRTEAQGEVDGVPVKMELLIFKKNNCNYTLSFGGVLKRFNTEKKYFDKFTESFKAP